MQKQVIFVSGYPKSGSTWLTRLLGDIFDSPTGGCMPEEDHKEIATEGQNRPGNYIIRKGHFVLIDNNTGPVVPRPHRLAWTRLTDERIVFLVRDPRDICISGAYHWRQKPEAFLERMIKGNVARCGRWDEYCNQYFETQSSSYMLTFGDCLAWVKYEDLLPRPLITLGELTQELELDFDLFASRAPQAIKRQSFKSRKAQIGDDEKKLRRNNMRKGITGDWKNHFTEQMNDRIWNEFGWMMERLGYEI